jgi:hypothetical protein
MEEGLGGRVMGWRRKLRPPPNTSAALKPGKKQKKTKKDVAGRGSNICFFEVKRRRSS